MKVNREAKSAPRGRVAAMRGVLAVLVALALVPAVPAPSFGVTEEIEARITEAQQQIEESAAAYDEAVARIAELEDQVASNTDRLKEIEQELPEQRERSDEALRALYKMNREGYSLIDMVLSSGSITEFISCIDYLSRFQERNVSAIEALTSLEDELEDTQASLDAALQEAEEKEQEASESLAVAKAAREQAQKEAQEQARREREAIEAAKREAERAAAEKAAAEQAAQEQEEAQAQEEEAAAEAEEEEASEQPTEAPADDGANWGDDKAAFVEQWGPRIDAYLAGSPMAGTGDTFASAAWDYGVDPRWSPAISAVESSKGAACFKSHNAWGWGSSSWGSWEEAINAHVAGLARGYGYTLSESAARKYCPPNWQHWYSRCAAEMNSI
ncbi:MAG: hypothetical protein UCH28_00320 [Adlercreutzia sp.]|nr:hypothetical protein [Adlercreutzia sp.]